MTLTGAAIEPGQVLLAAAAQTAEPMMIVAADDDRLVTVWINRALSGVLRLDAGEAVGMPAQDLLSGPRGELPVNSRRTSTFPVTLTSRDGRSSGWEMTAVPAGEDRSRTWTLWFRHLSSDDHLDELLQASEERFRALAERAPIGIFSSEVGLRWGYVNDQLAELIGISSEALLGTGWTDVVHPADLDAVITTLQATLSGESGSLGLRLVTTEGEERWVNLRVVPVRTVGAPAAFLGTIQDVTERRHFEELLSWQATHDPLTSLPNRSLLGDELAEALARPDGDVALLFFDLDDFKEVNDTLGHSAGDQLLVTVAERMRTAVRGDDTVFRFAGDEFVVLARGVNDDREAFAVGERLRAAVAHPLRLGGAEVAVHCSVGVVRAEGDMSGEELIRDADIAMYMAKRAGKGQVAVFDRRARGQRDHQLRLVDRLRHAVAEGALPVSLEPVTDRHSGRIAGEEVAVRFVDPEAGDVGELRCRQLAEGAGFINEFGAHLLRLACRRLQELGDVHDRWIAVRVSAAELTAEGYIDQLSRLVVSHGFTANRLWLVVDADELNEAERAQSMLDELRSMGIGVVLAGVGSGRCPLARLADLPVDAFRLDAADFTADLTTGPTIAWALTELARARGLTCIAETAGAELPDAFAPILERCDLVVNAPPSSEPERVAC